MRSAVVCSAPVPLHLRLSSYACVCRHRLMRIQLPPAMLSNAQILRQDVLPRRQGAPSALQPYVLLPCCYM